MKLKKFLHKDGHVFTQTSEDQKPEDVFVSDGKKITKSSDWKVVTDKDLDAREAAEQKVLEEKRKKHNEKTLEEDKLIVELVEDMSISNDDAKKAFLSRLGVV